MACSSNRLLTPSWRARSHLLPPQLPKALPGVKGLPRLHWAQAGLARSGAWGVTCGEECSWADSVPVPARGS